MIAFKLIDSNNVYTEVHFVNDGLSGFSLENGNILPVSIDINDVINFFKISEQVRELGIIDEYLVKFDEKSGLYHYFKDGKEDLRKLFYSNGEIDTLAYDLRDIQDSIMRKFKFFGYTLTISLLFINLYLVGEINERIEGGSWDQTINYNGSEAVIQFRPFSSKISFLYEGEEYKFLKDVTANKIKELLFDSVYLDSIEKNFLWNEELISKAVTYYDDDNFGIIAQMRHNNMYIESYTGDGEDKLSQESGGYYSGDEGLYVKNYQGSRSLQSDIETQRIAGHEFIHSLQADNGFKFIKESCAEIMTHEYYLNSTDNSIYYAYSKACQKVKILMEIIGGEAVWDYNFRQGSEALQREVKPYLTEDEYIQFFDILSLSPFWDSERLENGLYNRLDYLLGKLYLNRMGSSIYENDIINSIRLNGNNSKAYFRESLMQKPSYFEKIEFYSLEEVSKLNDNSFRVFKYFSEDDEEVFNKLEQYNKRYSVSYRADSLGMNVISSSLVMVGRRTEGMVRLKKFDEPDNLAFEMDIYEAERLGYVKLIGWVDFCVTEDELKSNKFNEFQVFPVGDLEYDYKTKMFYSKAGELVYFDDEIRDLGNQTKLS